MRQSAIRAEGGALFGSSCRQHQRVSIRAPTEPNASTDCGGRGFYSLSVAALGITWFSDNLA
jgi:hypothetical protein